MATNLVRTSLAGQVASALIELILDQGLKEGDALPSTGELADTFGVSRTVVREALADLAGRGVLSRSQGRESVVATPGSDELHGLLSFRVRRDNLDPMDIQEFREGVETQTAQLAAERRTEDHLAEMAARLEELATAKNDRAFHDADVGFHRALAVASANPLLLLVLDSLEPLLRKSREQATAGRRSRGESFDPVVDAHREILKKVKAGDPKGAARAMAVHLAQTRAGLRAYAKPAKGR